MLPAPGALRTAVPAEVRKELSQLYSRLPGLVEPQRDLVGAPDERPRAPPRRPDGVARFIAWTLEPDQRCAICDSRRHAVMPGVPPRLIPCDGLREVIAASDLPGGFGQSGLSHAELRISAS
ncbi:hypothetical protein OHA72_12160 [Dactylosporangium sp. NBC_01737]|uniref:hypothetical protein n=1 Tax=Dactylosporangium sp. NBC_01737 TaxID=2975959 RepID=UPI002E1321AB|nr:hypothetical protein OHA72_12160 [Dactylosporangium sp. NBC_01737]